MSTGSIPIIEGDRSPIIGFNLHYELKGAECYSVRWKILNKDGTALHENDRKVIEKVKTPYLDFTFLDRAAGQQKMLQAWYKLEESSPEMPVSISITPVLGPPAILTAIWQNRNKQDISEFSLETVCLAIRTANIPVGQKIKILFYDEELIRDKYAGEMFATVGENGKTTLVITRSDWMKIRRELKNKRTFVGEDRQYQIYAVATYDPVNGSAHASGTKKIEKSTSILTMINDPGKSLEALAKEMGRANKSVVVNVPDKNVEKDKIPVDYRIDVYFDGTMGNRWNIDAKTNPDRILEDGDTARNKLRENKAEHMLQKEVKDSSYDQVYTNMPMMFDLDFTEKEIREFKIYVEGVGSRKYGKDEKILGAGIGSDMRGTGIPSKIRRMLDEIKKQVKPNTKEEEPGEVKLVVFGFSRGAATARSFLSHRGDIARVLNTSEANISFEFVGIFDTVSFVLFPDVKLINSVPLPVGPEIEPLLIPILDSESVETALNNVKGLNLEMGANAKKIVHLIAGDEYRSFFKLTDIDSSINAGVGFELELPGSHCDLGGGDPDNMTESLSDGIYRGLVRRLINEGWHTEIIVEEIEPTGKYDDLVPFTRETRNSTSISKYRRYVERKIRAGYHKIPMTIMMHFAVKYAKVLYDPIASLYPIPEDLTELAGRMLSFADQQSGKGRASGMHILGEPQFSKVRNKYLHLSAFPESGKKGFDMVKDTVFWRNIKEGTSDWIPFMEADYSTRPERNVDKG